MTPAAKIRYENGFKLGLKIRKVAILSGLLLLGWHAHRTFIYAADIYHKSQVCEAVQCLGLADAEDKISQLPAKKGF